MPASFKRNNKGNMYDNANIMSVFNGTDAFVLEDELNEMQWNQVEARAEQMRALYTSGILNDFRLVQVDSKNSYLESIDGKPLSVLVDGYLIKVGGNKPTNPLNKDSRLLFDTTPENGVTENDNLHYLEFWFEVKNSTQTLKKFGGEDTANATNKMLDDRIRAETSRRIQMRWRVNVFGGSHVIASRGFTAMGDNLYKKVESPTYDTNGDLTKPGITYCIIFANGTHATLGNPVISQSAKAVLKNNNIRKELAQGESIVLNDTNNNFESNNVAGALDETKVRMNYTEEATAEYIRQKVQSGVLDYNSGILSGSSIADAKFKGTMYLYNNNTNFNRVYLTQFDSIINGYKIKVAGFNNTAADQTFNVIDLPAPPTYGTRDDLVFLEAFWTMKKPGDSIYRFNGVGNTVERTATTYEKVMEWRIRVVAGADFDKLPDGLGLLSYNYYHKASPQGGNTTPLASTLTWTDNFATAGKSNDTPNGATLDNRQEFAKDFGIYVAGNGTQLNKDLFKTYDGYVYAIPLMRVKRRNTMGYRPDNLNGSLNMFTTNPNAATIEKGDGKVISFVSTQDMSVFYVGQKLRRSNSEAFVVIVTDIDVTNKTITASVINKDTDNNMYLDGAQFLCPVYGRPDNKWANIITNEDIIDLRRKISLNGVDYQQLLEENFDKLLRGELQVKDKAKLTKEAFGLVKAPLNTQKALVPKTVIGNDGVRRSLINLLGGQGKGDITITVGPGGTYNHYYFGVVPLKSDKYYIFTTKTKFSGATSFRFLSNSTYSNHYSEGGMLGLSNFLITKITNQAESDFRIFIYGSPGTSITFTDTAVYEVDKATYDKVDVDAAFTGTELGKKFPYISSYPNIAENLFGGTIETGGIDSATGLDSTSTTIGRTKEFTKVSSSSTYTVSSILTQNSGIRVFYYDSGKNHISNVLGSSVYTFTTPANCEYVRFHCSDWATQGVIQLEKGDRNGFYVPYGRWFLPTDSANKDTNLRIDGFQNVGNRRTWSDKQVSEIVTDIIDPISNSHLPHITATQATVGQWKVGDAIKIKISAAEGIVGGLLDTDTTIVKIVDNTTNFTSPFVIQLEDVSKLAVGDKLKRFNQQGSFSYTPSEFNVDSINTANKTVVLSSGTAGSNYVIYQNDYFVETTASTSTPTVTAAGSAGNWTGLGTNEAIFTFTTAPTTNTISIKIDYAIHYFNGKGMVNLPSEVLEASVNGVKHIKSRDNIVKIKANFENKVAGNTDFNPHVMRYNGSATSLVSPSTSMEGAGSHYPPVYKLDDSITSWGSGTTNVAGVIHQHFFSFNIIRAIEDKFGENVFADCLTLADKITKAKAITTKISCNWWGFGSGPSGSKATINYWNLSNNSWITNSMGGVHANSTTTKITAFNTQTAGVMSNIDSTGFFHFNAYAEASDGVTASIIYTNYVELEIEINAAETGYDVFAPEISLPTTNKNLFNSNQAFPIDINTSDFALGTGVTATIDRPGVVKLSFNDVPHEKGLSFVLNTLPNKDLIFVADVKLTKCSLSSLNMRTEAYVSGGSPVRYTGTKTFVFKENETQTVTCMFNPGNVASNNTKFQVTVKPYSNGSVAVPIEFEVSNPRLLDMSLIDYPNIDWVPGGKKRVTLNYLSKLVNNDFENPHGSYRRNSPTFADPTNPLQYFVSNSQDVITNMAKQDGIGYSYTPAPVDAHYAQHLFEFDLSHLGLSLTELKAAVRKLVFNWVGYGQGNNADVITYGATMKRWRADNNSWFSVAANTSSSPAVSSGTMNNPNNASGDYRPQNYITNNQKVYMLMHSTYTANATSPSVIHTDYVSLEVELADYVDYVKGNIVKVQKETKELKLQYPKISYRTGIEDSIEVHFKSIPYQGLGKSNAKVVATDSKFTVLTYGTGANLTTSPYKNASTRLPKTSSTYKDYQLLEDPLLSNETIIDSKIMFLPINFGSSTGNGLTSLPSISEINGTELLSKDKLSSSVPHLTVICSLVVVNSELRLKVSAAYNATTTMSTVAANVDDYYLDGRLLIRGIYI